MLLLITVVGWGISWPFLKIALTEIPPWTFRGLIAPAAAILVFGIGALLKYDLGRPTGQWREISLAALLNITFWHIFSAFGIKLLGGGQASIIAYTMPLWAVLFSTWLIGETLTLARMAGLGVGMAGLAVLVSGEVGILASSPLGALFMLTAACAWGAGTTLQKKVKWKISPVSLVGWQLLIGGLPITITFFIDAGSWEPVSTAAVFSTIFVLVYPIILCWFAWFTIVDRSCRSLYGVHFGRSGAGCRKFGSGSWGSHRLAGDCLASPDLHCYRACPKTRQICENIFRLTHFEPSNTHIIDKACFTEPRGSQNTVRPRCRGERQ